MRTLSEERDLIAQKQSETDRRLRENIANNTQKQNEIVKYQQELTSYRARAEAAESELGMVRQEIQNTAEKTANYERENTKLQEELQKTRTAQDKAKERKVEQAIKTLKSKISSEPTPLSLEDLLSDQ